MRGPFTSFAFSLPWAVVFRYPFIAWGTAKPKMFISSTKNKRNNLVLLLIGLFGLY